MLHSEIDEAIELSKFHSFWEWPNYLQRIKKESRSDKDNYRLATFFLIYQNILKHTCGNKYHHIFITFSQKVNADF